MIAELKRGGLIRIALALIRIAILRAAARARRLYLLGPACRCLRAPGAGRAAELALECPGEGFARAEADRDGHTQHGIVRTRRQHRGADGQPAPLQIVAQRFAQPAGEDAVEVEGRKVRDAGQLVEAERGAEVQVDVVEHPIHAARVFRNGHAECGSGSYFFGN